MIPITFVDLETTGLDPWRQEIIELAAVKTNVGVKGQPGEGQIAILDSVEFKVQPKYPVEPMVAKLNGYNYEDWSQDNEALYVALGEVFRLMRGCWHAGSNPKFDEAFMKRAAEQFNWDYPKLASYHLLDVSMLAFPLLIDGTVEKLKQETIASHYEIGGGGHRAMSDTMQCLNIFARMNNLEIVWTR